MQGQRDNVNDLPEVDLTAHHRVRKTDVNKYNSVEQLKVTRQFFKIKCPARILVCGPSQIGKSHFIVNMMEHRDVIFSDPIEYVNVFLPPNGMGAYTTFKNKLAAAMPEIPIRFREGLPHDEDIINKHGAHQVYIFDDVMAQFFNSERMAQLMVQDSHHKNITVIATSQNFFGKNQSARQTILRNMTVQVLFWDRADLMSVSKMSTRLFRKPSFLLDAFEWLRKNPDIANNSRYIMVETTANTDMALTMQARSNIFPMKQPSGRVDVSPVFFMV